MSQRFYLSYAAGGNKLAIAQAGIKIAGRNINKLRYADDTTLMAESEKELKSLLMKVKEDSFESVLMRWMNLEPVIQSEVSQKGKDKYRILVHMYGI